MRWILHEILSLNIKLIAEWHFSFTHAFILGIVRYLHLLDTARRVICDSHFQRLNHSEHPGSSDVEIFTNSMFQQGDIIDGLNFCITDKVDEPSYRLGCISSSA